MSRPANPIPEGFHSVTPYITMADTRAAIDFYRRAFDAAEGHIVLADDGRVRHAQIRIGDSMLMLHDEYPEFADYRSAAVLGGSPVNLFLYVPDADVLVERALAAGATLVMQVSDQPYGRSGGIKDPFGLTWWITMP